MTQFIKHILLTSCTLLLFCCALSAQPESDEFPDSPETGTSFPPGTVISDNQRAGLIVGAESKKYCTGQMVFVVYAVNLELMLNSTEELYTYPSNEDDRIFLEYEVAGESGIVEIDEFKKSSQTATSTGHDVFEKEVTITADFESLCNASEGNEHTVVFYQIKLVDSKTNPQLYPYENNDHEEGIYSCEEFCDLECEPLPSGNSCIVSGSFSGVTTGVIIVDCSQCTVTLQDSDPDVPSDFPGGGGNYSDGSSGATSFDASVIEHSLSVIPNPFNARTSIQFEAVADEPAEMMIYDASGKLILQESIELRKGKNEFDISTANWQEGLFYGQIQSKDSIQQFKLIKVN